MLWQMLLRVYQKWSKSLVFCVVVYMCAFTHEQPRTRRYTILHPCNSDHHTVPKHNKSRQFRTTSGSVAQLFVSYFARQWMRSVDSPSPPSPLSVVLNFFELAEHSMADPTIDASHGANASAAHLRQ